MHRTDTGSSWHVGRRWGRLSVGWLGIVASPATLLAPGNSAQPDGQPWLYLDHSTLVQTTCQQSHLGAAGSHVSPAFCLPCHPHPQYTLSTPSAHPCHPYHPHPQYTTETPPQFTRHMHYCTRTPSLSLMRERDGIPATQAFKFNPENLFSNQLKYVALSFSLEQ